MHIFLSACNYNCVQVVYMAKKKAAKKKKR